MSAFSDPYTTLQQKFSRFTQEEDEFIFQRAETRSPSCVGALPFFECWKSSVRYSGSVLKCQQTRTACDVMLTFCVEDYRRPVNLIIDSAFNGVGSMHAALAKHFALDPDANLFEYSCLVRAVGTSGALQEERRVLLPGTHNNWLMHGHIIDVAKKKSSKKQAIPHQRL